jgi:hypothetical protein
VPACLAACRPAGRWPFARTTSDVPSMPGTGKRCAGSCKAAVDLLGSAHGHQYREGFRAATPLHEGEPRRGLRRMWAGRATTEGATSQTGRSGCPAAPIYALGYLKGPRCLPTNRTPKSGSLRPLLIPQGIRPYRRVGRRRAVSRNL